ncbi:MAG: galactose-binding domain-containing protein, partial [Planctomycetota bacterium]
NWFSETYLPLNTIDADTDSIWLNDIDDTLPTSIWWEFPGIETISKVGLWQTSYTAPWSYRIRNYEIFVSTNGTDWTSVATNTGTDTPHDYQETSFTPVSAKFVKITALYPSWEDELLGGYDTANWIGLDGFQAFDVNEVPIIDSPALLNQSSDNYFALSEEMGLRAGNTILIGDLKRTGVADPLVSHLEDDTVVRGWKLARRSSDSSFNHPVHWAQQVQSTTATVLAETSTGDPILTVKDYGQGRFIYHSEFNPLAGYSMHTVANFTYGFYRKAIEEAHVAMSLPLVRIGTWPWPYVAGFMTRHDHFSNFGFDGVSGTADDLEVAQIEADRGVQGVHLLRTHTALPLGSDACTDPGYGNTCSSVVQSNIQNMLGLGAEIGTHTMNESQEPAQANIAGSLDRLEYYLGFRPTVFVAPGGSGMRDATKQGLVNEGILTKGDIAFGAHPHFALKIDTATEYDNSARWPLVDMPATGYYGTPGGGGFAGGIWAHEITANPSGCNNDGTVRPCMEKALDFQYNLGGLVCLYDHIGDNSLQNANASQFAAYIDYAQSKPYMYTTSHLDMYDWWLRRDPVRATTSYTLSDPSHISVNLTSDSNEPGPFSIDINNLPWDGNVVVRVNGIQTTDYVIDSNNIRVKAPAPSQVLICADTDSDGVCDVSDIHSITALAGDNGTISPSGVNSHVHGGDDQLFTAAPDAHYSVDTWFVDGNSVQTGGLEYTLSDIQADHTVNVTFKQV